MPQTEAYPALRAALRELCARFPANYWRNLDQRRAYPEAFVAALTAAGYLGALIPCEYGGRGMSLTEASIIVEEINRAGGNAGPYHAQMYTMGTILRHGSAIQKQAYLPAIARGELRLQAFGVTEPDAGTDTASVTTTATREGDRYRINGRKIYISRVQHSDLLLLLARTTPREHVHKRTDGLSVFLVDLREAHGHGLIVTPIKVMLNNETFELRFTNVERARRLRPPHRPKPGRPISHCFGARACGGSGPDALPSSRAVRRRPAVWRRSQHGQAAGSRCVLGGRERRHANLWGLRADGGLRHRAEVPRDPALSDRPDPDESGSRLYRRARAGPTEVILMLPLPGIMAVAIDQHAAVDAAVCRRAMLL